MPKIALSVLLICLSSARLVLGLQLQPSMFTGRSRTTRLWSAEPSKTEAADTLGDRGLLNGIDVKTARYYSRNLPMGSPEDLKWLSEMGLFWEAVVKDAREQKCSPEEYVEKVYLAIIKFELSKKVHDREDFYEFLRDIRVRQSTLLLVLGGKSVGKSLVLKDFRKELEEHGYSALYVNVREFSGASLSIGILKAIQKRFLDDQFVLELLEKYVPIATSNFFPYFEALKKLPGVKLFVGNKESILSLESDIISRLVKMNTLSAEEALFRFVETAERRKKRPVLIIDEANKVLGLGSELNASSSVLDAIVTLTKEDSRMSVVMASSDYSYPYLLERNGLNLNDISRLLFAGEIPPFSMWELLVSKTDKLGEPIIGMGENLARLMMASYGGHFLYICESMGLLKMRKERFRAVQNLNPISSNIIVCLRKHPRKASHLLRQMAEFGYAKVETPNDPVVELIVNMNVGGMVSMIKSTVVGLPDDIWNDEKKFALVPTSESARNLIAMEVLHFEEQSRKQPSQEDERATHQFPKNEDAHNSKNVAEQVVQEEQSCQRLGLRI